ncbi:hypothetical protein G7Y89_g7284 [Cudoniella acicularis]|uniref:Rhodopsin domain-containing protein n=1 Tax=Cudoniella acicularis TaxID=354080 RepID=A0A8H4RMD5_9HELO|nr:hypothetical protein G7Y89_g7284 [Cudoniella acicularis]
MLLLRTPEGWMPAETWESLHLHAFYLSHLFDDDDVAIYNYRPEHKGYCHTTGYSGAGLEVMCVAFAIVPESWIIGEGETRVPQLTATNVTLLVIATIVMVLRFYTRSRITRYIGADDWIMLAAYILGLAQFGLWTAYDALGNAQHIWDVNLNNLPRFFLVLWLIQIFYSVGLGLIKLSILALFLRLFPSDRFRLVILCAMGFITAMTIALTLSVIFACKPVDANWDVYNPNCDDRYAQQIAASALAFSTDIVVLIMPMKYLLALRVSTKEKIQVIALMSLGAVSCIASVMRFKWLKIVSFSADSTWDGFFLSFWSSLEFYLAMITACAPAIKPFYVKYMRVLMKKLRGSRAPSSGELRRRDETPSNSSSERKEPSVLPPV